MTDSERPSGARHGAGRRTIGARRTGARVLSVIGICLLAFGLVCLGYVGYQLWGTNAASQQSYAQKRQQLKQEWQRSDGSAGKDAKKKTSATHVVPGDAVGLLSIPAIGLQEVPILEGTDADVLAHGVGHYTNTADAGQVGNFALAGHRITHGEPFAKLLQLQKGDDVIVETRSAIYTYEMDTSPRKLTVADTEGWVLDPVPGKKKVQPTKKLLTLTTCQDLFHSPDRSVGFGHLAHTQRK